VDSELGRGTTFQVLFPALSGCAPPVTDEPSKDSSWQGSGIVLVADDEPMVLSLASKMLHSLGFSVLTASDGDEVIRVFRERHREIDCLLLDLMMPRMDGNETCEALYQIRADVPVLLSSGYSERESTRRVAGKLAGFIQKPYTLATLREKLRQILEAGPESSRDSHRSE
jgi:CheY-like chemotaxis protein